MRLIGKLLALPFVLVTGILYLVCKFLVIVSGGAGAVLCSRILAGAFMAGDRVPDQPLRSANGGGLAGGDYRRSKQRTKGFCIWLNSFGGASLAAPPFFYNYGCLLWQLFDWRDFIERYNANLFSFCHLCA